MGEDTAPGSHDPALIEAAVGRNAAYYLRHWRRMDAAGKAYDWNWAACFFNVFWFAYRKMWWLTALLALDWIVSSAMLDPTNKPLFKLGLVILILPSFVTGGFGNWLYCRQTERLIADTADVEGAQRLDRLKARGGVSVAAMIASIVVVLALSALAGALAASHGMTAPGH
jgi:hypothetical protein